LSGVACLFVIGATAIPQSARQFLRDSSPQLGIPVGERREIRFRDPGYYRIRGRGDRSRPGRQWIDNRHFTDVLAGFPPGHNAPVNRNRKRAAQDQKKIGIRCTPA
jgi:hypothetical protein